MLVDDSGSLEASARSRRVPCSKTVPESDVFVPIGLALSEKQIPEIAENIEKMELLESVGPRPRQARLTSVPFVPVGEGE
jgi:hypothetical protein